MLRFTVMTLTLVLGTAALSAQPGKKLLEMNCSEVVEVLKKDKNVKLRRAALLILEGKFLDTDRGIVITAMTESLQKDDSADIRKAAAQTLGSLGEIAKSSVTQLGEVARRDTAPEVREAAARALGGAMVAHAKPALPLLVEALKDTTPQVRAAVAASLKDFGVEARLALPQILDAIQDKGSDRFAQAYLIQLVAKFDDDASKSIPVLLEVVKNATADATVRETAIDALGRLNAVTTPVQGALEHVLKDDKAPSTVRSHACAALTRIGGNARSLWPTVKGLITGADKDLRLQAIRLSGKLGKDEPEVVTVLVTATGDDHLETRLASIQELGELGARAKDAETALTNLARNDARAAVRLAATTALKKIRGE